MSHQVLVDELTHASVLVIRVHEYSSLEFSRVEHPWHVPYFPQRHDFVGIVVETGIALKIVLGPV